jgi:hypothetical protein
VAHVFGVDATPFRSDVRVANVGAVPETATLVFTRSGEDGRTSFSAFDVVLQPGQTAAFDDVVASAFHTAGTGSLEVLGDVVVMSRTYAVTFTGGTVGQQIPPVADTTALGERELVAEPLRPLGTQPVRPLWSRVNAGLVETSGGSGVVSMGGREFTIAPFSHVQFPLEAELLEVRVLSGDARVAAYLSELDLRTGDPFFTPAVTVPDSVRTLVAPVVHGQGAAGTAWRSDVWFRSFDAGTSVTARAAGDERELFVGRRAVYEDILGSVFQRAGLVRLSVTLPPGATAWSRTRSDGTSQYIPFVEPAGPVEQHLLFIETELGYRTNIGVVGELGAEASVTFYDAAGAVVGRSGFNTGTAGVDQMPVHFPIVNGRVTVRFVPNRVGEVRRGRAYASLIDERTGDPTFVLGQ